MALSYVQYRGMRVDNQEDGALWWVACGAAIAIVIYFALTGLPAQWLSPSGMVGQNGSLSVVLGTLTTIGAFLAARAAFLGYQQAIDGHRLAEQAELANRFQKAAELLGAATETPKIAGIQVLADVAQAAPSTYQKSVVRTLRQFIIERGRDNVDKAFVETKSDDWPPSGMATSSAIGAIARTPTERRWLGMESTEGRLRINDLYLYRARIIDADFSGFDFTRCAIGKSTFFGCLFDNVVFDMAVIERATFTNCRIKDCWINVAHWPDDKPPPVYFHDCSLKNVTVNGRVRPETEGLRVPLHVEVGARD